jgi:hypothetical protein
MESRIFEAVNFKSDFGNGGHALVSRPLPPIPVFLILHSIKAIELSKRKSLVFTRHIHKASLQKFGFVVEPRLNIGLGQRQEGRVAISFRRS